MACANATTEPLRRGLQQAAIAALTRSVELGLEAPALQLADPVFEPVRAHPEFQALISR
jgi:hypothetical protein